MLSYLSFLATSILFMSKSSNKAGGAATSAGINFQAVVSAIACIYMVRGQSLLWLNGLAEDIPVVVDAETGGAGDDLRLLLKSGETIEVQVKKGLKADDNLWTTLLSLARGVYSQSINYGVLIVSPTSSNTITEYLSRDIIRLGEGRDDSLSDIAKRFVTKLSEKNLPIVECCKALRIQTVHALTSEQADVRTARSELGHFCQDDQINAAWNSIYQDCLCLMELRGRRNASTVLQTLEADGIHLKESTTTAQLLLLNRLTKWVFEANANFSVFGVKKALPIDEAWIPLEVVVQDAAKIQPLNLAEALKLYHAWDSQTVDRDAKKVDPETLCYFITRAVLIGGPGMGKSTLLKRIARRYSEERIPVLQVKLKAVAASMQAGQSFEDALFNLGLDGSGISSVIAQQAKFANWLLLCDGLDECGKLQNQVATGIERFALGHPDCRVLITTRPVGYEAAHFSQWRHYSLLPLSNSQTESSLVGLVHACQLNPSSPKELQQLCRKELQNRQAEKIIARSPLILSFAASILARGGRLGNSKEQLFEQIIHLIDEAPNSRTPEPPASASSLQRYLDIIGWYLTDQPLCSVNTLMNVSATTLAQDFGYTKHIALEKAQFFLQYWQDAGIIERIGTHAEETISFIHKSFGAFVAARYLFDLSSELRFIELERVIDDLSWKEVIDFAVHLGLANEVCEALLDRNTALLSWSERVIWATEILANTAFIEENLRHRILDEAFKIVSSEEDLAVDRIGNALVLASKKFPNEIGSRASVLLQDQKPWTYIVAWAIVVAAGKAYYSIDQLAAAVLVGLDNISSSGFQVGLDGSLKIQSFGKSFNLYEFFIFDALEVLLKEKTVPEFSLLLEKCITGVSTRRTSYLIKLHEVLVENNQVDTAERVNKIISSNLDYFSSLYKGLDYSDYDNASLKRYEVIFEALGVASDILDISSLGIDPKALLNFSAFNQVSELERIPDSDVWVWTGDYDKDASLEVVKLFINLTGINLELLRKEAQLVRSYLYSVKESKEPTRLYKLLSEVDPLKINWSAIRKLGYDIEKVKRALFHPSVWIVWIAVNLIENLLSQDELHTLAKKLLSEGDGYTLWGVRGLLAELDKDVAVRMLVERLSRPLNQGCEYLYENLQTYELVWSNELFEILAKGLHADIDIAMQASKLILNLTTSESRELEPLICEALIYWAKHEKPYPVSSGTIPNSPRDNLLKSLTKMRPLTYLEFKKYIDDPRSDIKSTAKNALADCLRAADELIRWQFLKDIQAEVVSSHLLNYAIDGLAPLTTIELETWQQLLEHNNPTVRYAAISSLSKNHLEVEIVQRYARMMLQDEDHEIRKKVARILKDL
ncbi:MAG: NACHT domain-containing protein [Thiothrix sp.]|nr:MAG: NACHT domain-containing protein [Thiothrix sp.]